MSDISRRLGKACDTCKYYLISLNINSNTNTNINSKFRSVSIPLQFVLTRAVFQR